MTLKSPQSKSERLITFLSLDRNVTAASGAVFLLGLGEELWKKFLPKYLQALGASVPVMGFSVQSILKRVPAVIAPLVGGWLIAKYGIRTGIRMGLIATLVIAVATVFLIRTINIVHEAHRSINIFGVWKSFHGRLKRLLI